ncbi:DUF1853 family protein [Tenacibaculum maritimum]|uniref:DUF1853 family protein n=1 Tax=Tenacibaculum maritimum NCIMB 2154 TaxID=1349785 RepID=A0A2H1EAA1_9FLAO|nr:DUF1853 family protein [Tenacibaculum maritimum]SFZ82109.1 conserved protein of unknown function [Tenacibaculum maritimum NCIMB 2154]
MPQKSKELQYQYEGFLQTPFLWQGKGVFGITQYETPNINTHKFTTQIPKKPRLGKLVERFVSFELQQQKTIDILIENVQIQQEKRTLGELDCLLLKNQLPIHLEIIYKFYLYDATVGNTEMEHWISPNRKDSLIQKLTKLKEKQLPLLYHPQTAPLLKKLQLKASHIQQQVYFKAQLFTPLNNTPTLQNINNKCLSGFYINIDALQQFSNSKFYIPSKHNWLTSPHTQVKWLSFNEYTLQINHYLQEKKAPLCWLKKANGQLLKFFVVWW